MWTPGERVDRSSPDPRQNLGVVGIGRIPRRAARIGRTPGTAPRRDVLVQHTRKVAEQHPVGLVQVEARRQVHAADSTAAPDERIRAATRPAPAPSVDGVVAQQHVQRSARPALRRAKATAPLGVHGSQQGVAQRLSHQLMAGLIDTAAHAEAPRAGAARLLLCMKGQVDARLSV